MKIVLEYHEYYNRLMNENVQFSLPSFDEGETTKTYYRPSFIKRDGSIGLIGSRITVVEKTELLYDCLERPMYHYNTKEVFLSSLEGSDVEFLPKCEMPNVEKQTYTIDVSNYQSKDIEDETHILIDGEGEFQVVDIKQPIIGEYVYYKGKLFYNPKYTLRLYREYKAELEAQQEQAKREGLQGKYKPYTFQTRKRTNRMGWRKLLINGEVWPENHETDEVKIITHKRIGNGGGRYRVEEWELMVDINADVEELYEGDIQERFNQQREEAERKKYQKSSGFNPFEGLSDLIGD